MSERSNILVVDDNEVQRGLMISRLMKAGFITTSAESGENALKNIREHSIDLVLLDLHMPGMDGHEVLEKTRENFSSLELPIIIVTAEDDSESVYTSFEKGANDYIVKGLSFKVALQRIRTQLKMKELARKSAHAHQMEAMNAMIVTYNHEINNPLAIAYGNLGSDINKLSQEKLDRAIEALERIKNLVLKIQNLDLNTVEFSEYSQDSKMVKIS